MCIVDDRRPNLTQRNQAYSFPFLNSVSQCRYHDTDILFLAVKYISMDIPLMLFCHYPILVYN